MRAIPTWVGKSNFSFTNRKGPAGHPHVGGEIKIAHSFSGSVYGPSPRGWGNRLVRWHNLPCSRAIPTWVGKSVGIAGRRHRRTGHPHVGGEIRIVAYAFSTARGPSPRGWGNLHCRSRCRFDSRAIPTWVGKSSIRHSHDDRNAGHPHVGGEIEPQCTASDCEYGPSPRGWGNHRRCPARIVRRRAIPTWVGKSIAPEARKDLNPGHPHVGGEILPMNGSSTVHPGPSPRGWGNRADHRTSRRLGRAIPTWVGKSIIPP